MKISKSKLIAYAMSFISFVLPKTKEVREIILFGSASRGESDECSDIDLFFETDKNQKKKKEKLDKELKKFYRSDIYEKWTLKGIENPIRVNVGELEEWDLKRSVISDGVSLYSKYKELPKDLEGFMFFNFSPIKDITKRNRIVRKLFGRKEKNYSTEGIVIKMGGKKLSCRSFIVPLEKADEIIDLFKKEKISYILFEFWTDQIEN